MTAFGKSGVRCDSCGRISKDALGAYHERGGAGIAGYVNSQGRNCEHDFCDNCEGKLNPDGRCCKCGVKNET